MFSEITFKELETTYINDEGLILLGCGGDPNEWFNGVGELLKGEGCAANGIEDFSPFYKLTTTGGRNDLVMMFKKGGEIKVDVMAMWRIRFRDCSWLSDYFVNYAHDHGLDDRTKVSDEDF